MASNYDRYYSGPKLVFHGGLCCGIKTLVGFHNHPTSKCFTALSEVPIDNSDKNGDPVKSSQRFFTDAAPAGETFGERHDRHIEFVKKRRPQHVIEAVLAEYQYASWKDWLKKRRFRKVSTFVNSNTDNTVHIFHKYIGQPKKKKVVPDPFGRGE